MKYLKLMILAVIAVFSFGIAEAQVHVQIGGRPHPYHRRVVRHRWHRPVHRRVVVVHHRR
ncbi:MAG TPA: hypothetical protein VGC01_08070 [Mucilaginibacter sp.]